MCREQTSTQSNPGCRCDFAPRWRLRPLGTFSFGPDDHHRPFDNHNLEFDDLDHRGTVDHDHDAGIDHHDNPADHDDDATAFDDDTATFDHVDRPSQLIDHLVYNDNHCRPGAGDPIGLQRPIVGWRRLVH